MENISKYHVVILCVLLCLLIIAPFLSSNTRLAYLYFIANLLIIALGVESGLLSLIFSYKSSSHDKMLSPSSSHNYLDVPYNHSIDQRNTKNLEVSKNRECNQEQWGCPFHSGAIQTLPREETPIRRDNGGYNYKLPTKSSSMPSLFFIEIGGNNGDTHSMEEMAYVYDDDNDDDSNGVEEEEDEVINGEISGQELYVKAEAFIGNFYKQLRLQRQNSLRRIYRSSFIDGI